ncbi:MAG: hypothetical protein KDI09_06405 [Halioglobus sp.]|nr:hypothetical protein [Halioglobus sp.]
MTSVAANANRSLYLSRILLAAWRKALAEEAVPALTLQQAFLPGAREHLVNAYGWFLLEITDASCPPGAAPPRCASELPEVPEGKAVSGELRECQRLEQVGWLGDLLSGSDVAPGSQARTSGNLASPAQSLGDCADVTDWAEQLETMMTRMRDSLDEY